MNITCEIYYPEKYISFNYTACNKTEAYDDFKMSFLESVDLMTVLLSFPINSYVIWLIVTGIGNGISAEILNLNFSICEIFYCMECLLASFFNDIETVKIVVDFLDGCPITGRPLFQCLICVERYLAVVHPVIFLKYKPFRYRLMYSAVAWVICFCSGIFIFMTGFFDLYNLFFIYYFAQFFLFLSIQLYCCLAVLRALKQSGPGERGREREEENHMKRRAFNLILITNVTMVIIYAPQIALDSLVWITNEEHGILGSFSYVCFLFRWFGAASSLSLSGGKSKLYQMSLIVL